MSRVDVDGGPDDQCMSLLLQHAENAQLEQLINTLDRNGFSALHFATQAGRVYAVRKLLTHGKCSVQQLVNAVADQTTALMISIKLGNYDLCRLMLEASADLRPAGEAGSTALHYATDLVCSMPDKKDILELVIANSADLTAFDDNGYTALHCATYNGAECVQTLLAANCEPDVRGSEAAALVTPLMLACCHNHEATAQFLLAARASVRCADRNGWGCIHHAASYGAFPNGCVGAVVRAGATVDGRGLDCLPVTDRMFSSVCTKITHAKAVAMALAFHCLEGGPLGVFSDLCKQMVALDATTPLIESVKNGKCFCPAFPYLTSRSCVQGTGISQKCF